MVSKHPFVGAAGDWLLHLHDGTLPSNLDGEGVIDTFGPPDSDVTFGNRKGPSLNHAAAQLQAILPGTQQSGAPVLKTHWTDSALGNDVVATHGHQSGSQNTPVKPIGKHIKGSLKGNTHSCSLPTKSPSSQNQAQATLGASMDLGTEFMYPAPVRPRCPHWANSQARQRCDALMRWAAKPLLSHLSVDVLLQVMSALLLELKVVVVSPSAALSSAVVLGLSTLLWPFRWQHLLLPVCPAGVQDIILDAPVPFLCALPEEDTARHSTANLASRHGVVVLKVTDDTVIAPPTVEKLLSPQALPQALRQRCPELARLQELLRRGAEPKGGPGTSSPAGSPAPSVKSLNSSHGSSSLATKAPQLSVKSLPGAISQRPWLLGKQAKTGAQLTLLEQAKTGAQLSAAEVVASMCRELHQGTQALAGAMLNAASDVSAELGTFAWMHEMGDQMCTRLHVESKEQEAFLREVVCTQTCVMFLGVATK